MTILVVEDQELNREMLAEILKDKYIVLQAANGLEAIDILNNREDVAAIILDIIMPVMDGFQFMNEISDIPEKRNIPIIVATEFGAVENEKKALELGAYDFVSKPYDPAIVALRVGNAIEHSRLETLEKLNYLEEFDQLTGIYNKSSFMQETRHLLNEASYTDKVAIVRFDITHFSMINAYYGLEEGDKLLKYMANVLLEEAKKHEWMPCGRLEADDFAFSLIYDRNEDIEEVISRIKDELSKYKISFNVVLIFGIYLITDREKNIESMLDNANEAAKKIKGNYLNTVAYYDNTMSERKHREQEIVNEMKNALESEQFVVYLQPKYDSEAGLPCGAEALIRWKHPDKGMIPPGVFIPVFESNGFVEPVDHYMWEHVCQLLRKWLDEGRKPTPISVNVSRVNLYNPRIVEEIEELTEKYKVPRNLLQLEITESAYTDNVDMVLNVINNFHTAGFTILMDDFGSGYSSLNVLKDMEVDVLKIDMKFFGKTDNASRAETIVSSVVRMAKWLNIATVAEGVETREQVDFLSSIGCTTIQGYYYARPMPVDEYEKLVSSGVKFIANEDNYGAEAFIWANSPEINEQFANVLEPLALSEVLEDGIEVLRVNQAYYDLFGYEDRIMFVKHPEDRAVTDEDRHNLENAYKEVVNTGANVSVNYNRYNSNGEIVHLNAVIKLVKSFKDSALVICSFAKDDETEKDPDEEIQIRNILTMCENQRRSGDHCFNSMIPECNHLPEMINTVLVAKNTEKHALLLISVDNAEQLDRNLDESRRAIIWNSMEVVLNQYFRNNDFISYIGNHEYCVFMIGVPSTEVVKHKCHELCRRFKVFGAVSRSGLSVSIGVAISSKDDTEYTKMYNMAHEALEKGRERGKGCVFMMTSDK